MSCEIWYNISVMMCKWQCTRHRCMHVCPCMHMHMCV